PRHPERVAHVVQYRVHDGLLAPRRPAGRSRGTRGWVDAHEVSERFTLRNRRASSSSIRTTMLGSSSSTLRNRFRVMVSVDRGVSATTEAVRGPPSIRAISPKKSPGRSWETLRPTRSTLAYLQWWP